MRKWPSFFLFICLFPLLATANERLRGFVDHQTQIERFDQQRELASDEVKRKRQEWDQKTKAALETHKKKQKKLNQNSDESGDAYQEDIQRRLKEIKEHERARKKYSEQIQKQKTKTNELQGIDEFGLTQVRERVVTQKRKLFGKPGGGAFRPSSGGSSYTPSTPAPPPPPPNTYVPPELDNGDGGFNNGDMIPPATPGGDNPDFYEPPMPMDEGGMMDEDIPPPVFEESEF